MADGSLEETKYHLLLGCDLKYMNKEEYESLSTMAEEIGRMLSGFQKKLTA